MHVYKGEDSCGEPSEIQPRKSMVMGMNMDMWKYYGILHRFHAFMNPLSEHKFERIISVLDLSPGKVVDIACGKAELLCRLAEAYDVTGIGIDISPYEVEDAVKKVASRGLSERIDIREGDGSTLKIDGNSLSAAFCIGATWVFGGLPGTLAYLHEWVKPGGLVVVGDVFRRTGFSGEQGLNTHAENTAMGEGQGLTYLYSMGNTQSDWDHYTQLTNFSAQKYAVENPDDPDVPELLGTMAEDQRKYFEYERDAHGWGVYIFMKPPGH